MYEIRLANHDDLSFLVDLEEVSFAASDRFSKRSFERSIKSRSQYVYIIAKHGKSLGSAILFLYKNAWRLYSFAVLPEYQNQHIGAYLLQEIIKRAEEKYLHRMTLEVNAANTKALNFYERFGFKVVKALPDYYGLGVPGLKMERVFYKVSQKIKNIVVIDEEIPFLTEIPDLEIITADRFINDSYFLKGDYRVFNMCRDYSYQKTGYYVSLFAAARNYRAIPNIATIEDFNDQAITRSIGDEIKGVIRQTFKSLEHEEFVLSITFGKTQEPRFKSLAYLLSKLFPAPFLTATFKKEKQWNLVKVAPSFASEHEITPEFISDAEAFFHQKKFINPRFRNYKYDLAILIDEQDPAPPSNKMALRCFLKAAHKMGFYTEFITKEDYHRLRQFDALFIRTTTNPNDYTYQFSRLAYAEGLIVIDDPWSILRCANKVYLHESMNMHNIPTPVTMFVTKDTPLHTVSEKLGFPLVLKKPDSSASLGVFKARDEEELQKKLDFMFTTSDIVLAQEFIKSDFDWRVGVLNNKAIYVCKYFMAKNHWQIYNWKSSKSFDVGAVETFLVEEVPENVIKLALEAAAVMGEGFYGVDIKEAGNEVYVIEVNDNPSVDRGWEDARLGDELYNIIIREIYDRIEKARTFKSRLSLPDTE